jgi:hypothetical protein
VTHKLLEVAPESALIDRFAEACVTQDRALLHHKIALFNKAYLEMKAVDLELRKRGRDARLALRKLYDHPNMQVRLQAATLTLGVAPVEAHRVIEAIARSGRMPQTADARGTLRELNAGVFKPN